MSTIIASTLLDSHPAAFKPLFSPLPIHDTTFFDEGPRLSINKTHVTSSLSGSMNTSAIDPYTQGVELTRQVQYDAGLAKIWSGEPGHRLMTSQYGMSNPSFIQPRFKDLDLFNPLVYIQEQEKVSAIYSPVFTYPIVTGDSNQSDNFNLNGVIEPLTIRSIISFFSIESPNESHTVRGAVCDGNIDHFYSSDRVLTVDEFQPKYENIGFLDMVDMFANKPLNGQFRYEFSKISPFIDQRLIRNIPSSVNEPADVRLAMSSFSGSTDNYLNPKQRSASCGWYYDNNAGIGTDSLAFGGMTY